MRLLGALALVEPSGEPLEGFDTARRLDPADTHLFSDVGRVEGDLTEPMGSQGPDLGDQTVLLELARRHLDLQQGAVRVDPRPRGFLVLDGRAVTRPRHGELTANAALLQLADPHHRAQLGLLHRVPCNRRLSCSNDSAALRRSSMSWQRKPRIWSRRRTARSTTGLAPGT